MTTSVLRGALLGASLALAGCVGGTAPGPGGGAPLDIAAQDWRVARFEVDVPRTLTVSEANTLKPASDIVWRGDPPGDRYAQVDALMTAALAPAFAAVSGEIPVFVNIEVTRFHAQTERVRYSNVPSQHEIEFLLTISHAQTGQVLSGPHAIDLTFPALRGDAAIAAEAQGETQAVRITQRLQSWVAASFSGAAAVAPAPAG